MKKTLVISLGLMIIAAAIFLIFIPAFSGKLQINPLINLGIFQIRWYGVIMAVATLASYFVARKNAWRFGLSESALDDYAFWLVICGVVGARLYYVLFNLNYFAKDFTEVYKVWHGGLSIYGGILAGLGFTYFYSRDKAFSFAQVFDLIALSVPLGQAIGRLGNFVNQEAYGSVTNLPWKMYVNLDGQFHHPAFLYEALLDLAIFGLLWFARGKTKSGSLGLIYLASYSFGRFFIESLRVDSFFISGFRVDQVVAFVLFFVAGIILLKRQKH